MGHADVGSAAFRARYTPGATVGLANPVTFANEAQSVDTAARQLLGEVQARLELANPLRQQYEAWFTTVWSPFFANEAGPSLIPGRRLVVTDAADATLQTHRSELADFQQKLVVATQAPSNVVVPPDPRTLPTPPPKPQGGGGGQGGLPSWWPNWAPQVPKIEVPWWVWVGGTLLVGAAGYGLYRSWKKQREIQQTAIGSLSGLLAGNPHAYGEVVQTAARDAAPASCGCASCGGH